MARTMLLESGLPRNFWAEAVSTACYILNRIILRPLLKKTPYELLRGRKTNIVHLRIFGCKCFVHNNGKSSLDKFDPRSDEAVFVGYSSHSKAYKVFNKRTLCVEESIHVLFDETNMFSKHVQVEDADEFEIGMLNFTRAKDEEGAEPGSPHNSHREEESGPAQNQVAQEVREGNSDSDAHPHEDDADETTMETDSPAQNNN
ncbi:hypothetical protein BVRB_016780 [Beta vulgaris subsp. vulgaris]|uniref:Retroviral polymerase SH3-like domain-containing protein n=1 Tax=Beta vulgaris subsp. vulgaris TaxID=3555 RepID=A0A0J8DUX6_BETVV|nr:hypothetical protein BVRB_016780 [Beta vulgaris subsp. vulgaris]